MSKIINNIAVLLTVFLSTSAWAAGTRYLTTIHFPLYDNGKKVRSVRVIAGIQLPSTTLGYGPLRAIADFPLQQSGDARNGFFRYVLFKGQYPEQPRPDRIEQGIVVKFYIEYDGRPGIFEERTVPLSMSSPMVAIDNQGTANSFTQRLRDTCQSLCQFPPNVSQSSMQSYRCADEGNHFCPESERVLPHPCCRDLVVVE